MSCFVAFRCFFLFAKYICMLAMYFSFYFTLIVPHIYCIYGLKLKTQKNALNSLSNAMYTQTVSFGKINILKLKLSVVY